MLPVTFSKHMLPLLDALCFKFGVIVEHCKESYSHLQEIREQI